MNMQQKLFNQKLCSRNYLIDRGTIQAIRNYAVETIQAIRNYTHTKYVLPSQATNKLPEIANEGEKDSL